MRILSLILFSVIMLFPIDLLAVSTCNKNYAGCSAMTANVDCSYCAGGYTGRYGYIDFGAVSCCVDTNHINIATYAYENCVKPSCVESGCTFYPAEHKYACSYIYEMKYDCSTNVITKAPACTPRYKCEDGYYFNGINFCNSIASNYGQLCSCLLGCTINEYTNEYNECEQCPVVSYDLYGDEQYGVVESESQIGYYSLGDCFADTERTFYNTFGAYKYINNCFYQ